MLGHAGSVGEAAPDPGQDELDRAEVEIAEGDGTLHIGVESIEVQGRAWHGMAWHGWAGQGMAWHGWASVWRALRHAGMVILVRARRVLIWSRVDKEQGALVEQGA